MTLADAFCDVPVASPVAIVDSELTADKAGNAKIDAGVRYDETARGNEPCNKLRCLSKYLVQFVPDPKPKNTELL